MSNIKIIPHVFHSFYTFGYFEPKLKAGAPELLYANWPIINRVPLGSIPPNQNKIKKFSSLKEVRQWIEDKNDIKDEDYCENFIRISEDNFHKYRQLFHGLIKHYEIEHKFQSETAIKSKGPLSRTCCRGVPLSFTAKYEEGGGHQCDDAIFDLSCNGRQIGNINLNNASDGGSRSSGPFTMSAEEVEALSGGGCSLPLTLKCATGGRCHQGFTSIEIKNTDTGEIIANVGLSEGTTNVKACYVPEDDFSDEFCCCPPKYEKREEVPLPPDNGGPDTPPSTTSSLGGLDSSVKFLVFATETGELFTTSIAASESVKCVKSKGYECNRNHKKIIKGDIKYDGVKIFSEGALQKRVGARESRKRNIKDVEPPKDNPSNEEEAYKKDTLTIQDEKVFKKEWEFDNEKFKSLFNKSKTFPRNSTRINDPVFEYLVDTTSGYLKIFSYIEMIGGLKKESFLKGRKKLESKNLGNYTLDISSQNMSDDIERDIVTYYTTLNINNVVYLESQKEYLIFFDLSSKLDLGNIALSWKAGDFPTGNKDEESGDYIESLYPEFENNLPFKDIALYTNKTFFSSEENEENGKISKIKLPVSFVFEGSPEDLEFECFRFEKSESKVKKNEDEDGKRKNCVQPEGQVTWDLDNFKIEFHGWWQNDFKRGTSFPNPIT